VCKHLGKDNTSKPVGSDLNTSAHGVPQGLKLVNSHGQSATLLSSEAGMRRMSRRGMTGSMYTEDTCTWSSRDLHTCGCPYAVSCLVRKLA
jgi:hypothetical protein